MKSDEVTRLILDSHDAAAFASIAHLTVGEFREWLLSEQTGDAELCRGRRRGDAGNGGGGFEDHAPAGPGYRPEPSGRVVTRFRDTLGLAGRFSTRLQPNHPTDDSRGIAASVIDGLLTRTATPSSA